MTQVRALAAPAPSAKFESTTIERRELRPEDVRIEIDYAGICHSDTHQARNEWREGIFPMVPGHEIVGRVVEVGSDVTKFAVGDLAGVGVMVDSCGECEYCLDGRENVCLRGNVQTYNGRYYDGTPTYGGYSREIVVKESFVLNVPSSLDLAAAAPLLCAGITVYLPLRDWGAAPGKRVAVLGIGGLGHLGVKIAAAMGAEVTALGRSEAKRADALAFGANEYLVTTDPGFFTDNRNRFDVILNASSADLDVDSLLDTLRVGGALVNVGLPGNRQSFDPFSVVGGMKSISGSNTGGIRDTQEMLDFCAQHGITADIELIEGRPELIDEAYDRMVASDVRYRFVIDAKTI